MDMDNIEEYVIKNNVDMAIICTNKDSAQDVANKLVECGIKAIWNFAPTDLKVPDDVIVENVHLVESLLTLTYLYKTSKE
jgi:redox-sensing transcriptional repressor